MFLSLVDLECGASFVLGSTGSKANFPSVDASFSFVVVIEMPIAWKASFYDNRFFHFKISPHYIERLFLFNVTYFTYNGYYFSKILMINKKLK